MIKLKRIEFHGFQAEKRIAEVNFSDDQVSVIYGENGCGKTTFLKLMHSLLTMDTGTLLKEKVARAKIKYNQDGIDHDLIIERTKTESPADHANETKATIAYNYTWERLAFSPLGESKSLSLGVERGISSQATRIDTIDIIRVLQQSYYREFPSRVKMHEFAEELASSVRRSQIRRARHLREEFDLNSAHCYLQNIKLSNIENLLLDRYTVARELVTEKIQNALFDTLATAIEQSEKKETTYTAFAIPADLGNTILQSKERIIEALNDGTVNNFKGTLISFLENFKKSDEIYKIKDNKILLQLIVNMVNQLQIEKQMLSSINIFIENFNKYLSGNKELIITKNEVYVDADGEHCSIDTLSSGERHVFTFLALIVVAGRGRDFLIIDEPEISLNIKWQRTLVQLLKNLLPDTQIILASHSPAISRKTPQSLVELSPYKKVESNV